MMFLLQYYLALAALLSLPLADAFLAPSLKSVHSSKFFASTLHTQEDTGITPPVAPNVGLISAFSLSELPDAPAEDDLSVKPGQVENDHFACHPSVANWETFESEGSDSNFQRLGKIVTSNALQTRQSRAYWLSHVLRTSYFTVNAAAGLIGYDLLTRFITNRNAPADASALSNGGGRFGDLAKSDIASRLLLETSMCYEQDWDCVKSGLIRFPWDAFIRSDDNQIKLQADHKQMNPIFALSQTARLVRESIGINSRQSKYKGKAAGIWFSAPTDKTSSISYPSYYLNDFHYQTDGWMSSESAERYEVSTETLFLGRQDVMQRQTLIPLKKHFGTKDPSTILEVACGTGRFSTFTRDNFRSASMTLVDLSPFYLEKARDNDAYWREYQKLDNTSPANLVQANAEDLPFDDETFDAVTCVYLFHELPKEARERAAGEMARVVKPGGMVVLTDSMQLGDRPPLDSSMAGFSNLNEPHYKNYISTQLSPLFEEHGLVRHEKYLASTTKTLSFIKKL